MCQRAISVCADSVNIAQEKPTMDDMHAEFHQKCNSPNRGLKPGNQRILPDVRPETLSDFQKLQNEFKAKVVAKNANQIQ